MSRITELEAMLDSNPEDPFLQYALAREHESAKSTMQALMMYEHLINQHPDYVATYYHYARLLYSLGNRNEAIRLLKTGIQNGIDVKEMHAVSEMKSLLDAWEDE
jgi:predicted Zn-dependent protease